jgi:peptidoglycan/LPS O-acetylase OafA/YrhL
MCYTLLELCVLGSIVFAFAITGSDLVKMLGAKYVSIWTISASLLVYLYAVNRGHISSISVNRFTLYIAELSSYTFLIHQVVIRYFHIFTSNAKEHDYITHLVVPLLAFLITILLANRWRTFEKRKQR